MAELVDARDSKSREGNLMWVRSPLWALRFQMDIKRAARRSRACAKSASALVQELTKAAREGGLRRSYVAPDGYAIASMIAFSVALGRIAFVVFAMSGW